MIEASSSNQEAPAQAAPHFLHMGFEAHRSPVGAYLLGFLATGVALVGVLRLDHLPLSVCLFKFLTGCPCPTCGTTRAFGRLFARDLGGAFRMNPLAVVSAFGVGVWGFADLAGLPWRRALVLTPSPSAARIARWGALVAVLVNWGFLIASGR